MELQTQVQVQLQLQLPILRQLLIERQAELRAEVHVAQLARQAAQMGEGDVTDFKEGAERAQQQQTDDFQAARDLRELHDVDDALARLEAGSFGDCAVCGEPIAAARLIALPSVRLCTPCQAARERRP